MSRSRQGSFLIQYTQLPIELSLRCFLFGGMTDRAGIKFWAFFTILQMEPRPGVCLKASSLMGVYQTDGFHFASVPRGVSRSSGNRPGVYRKARFHSSGNLPGAYRKAGSSYRNSLRLMFRLWGSIPVDPFPGSPVRIRTNPTMLP